MILYPIGQAGRLTDERGDHKPPFGFAVVFPDRKGKGDLKSYRMNDIALEKDSMSFTADIYNEILSDIFLGTGQTSPFAMRLVKFDNGIMIAFAVNIATRMRSAFLSVTSEAPKSRFPHWKGVEIKTATLPAYGIDTPFVGLSQLPNSASDIFEIVVEDLRRKLEAAENTEESLSVIITV